jgi:predicted lipoprotein with Yx(FWY)xxD motif
MRRTLIGLVVTVLILAACGGDDDTGASEPSPSQEEPTGPTISLASTAFGDALVDQDGRTLYMFVPDQQKNGMPTCYDDCAQAWPALEGQVGAGEGVDGSQLGTVERKDGTQQATYNDLPLYYFSGDQAAGDVNGQGLGDVWWVVDASGTPVEEQPTRVSLASTDLGDVLVDGEGMTLYMFVPDQQKNGTPTCYGECETAWPPLEAAESGVFLPGEGVDGSLLATAERKDGTQQVTYNELPLYVFSGDKAAGDVNGQGLGDVWWVVDATGEPIEKAAGN